MYSADGEVYETILVQKNRTEGGFMWILGPDSFRVIGLFESQMQASTIILTKKSDTSTVQIPSIAHVKLEPTDHNVVSYLENDICASVDISITSSFPFRSIHSTSSQLPIHVSKFPCGPITTRETVTTVT